MITFPEEVSWPLSEGSIISEHFGVDPSLEANHHVCDTCGTDFVHKYELDTHYCGGSFDYQTGLPL